MSLKLQRVATYTIIVISFSVIYEIYFILQAVVFSNPEEELIVAESELCIDYDVSGETDADVSIDFDGVEMTPWRRIVVFTADKLDDIITNVRQTFPSQNPA